jgi:hypothetical protein
MCDYSLCGIPNRLATEGEELVVHKFSTGSMGLASAADLSAAQAVQTSRGKKSFWETFKSFFEPAHPRAVTPAVCIPPGAYLILRDIPQDLQKQCDTCEEETVIFTQISSDVNTYRDAVRFRSGRQIRLQELHQGMRARVLSLEGVTEYTPVMAEALR